MLRAARQAGRGPPDPWMWPTIASCRPGWHQSLPLSGYLRGTQAVDKCVVNALD